MSEIDLPVLVDDELKVRCEYSGCNATTTVQPSVDAKQTAENGDRWALTFVPNAEGVLEVKDAQCPQHRIEDQIDALAREQRAFNKEFQKSVKVTEKLMET